MSYMNMLNFSIRRTTRLPFGGPKLKRSEVPTRNHLLVVEDDREILELLKSLKKKHNLPIDFAASSGEAISLVSKKAYDVVLLDWNLPDFNGDDFIKLSDNLYFNHCRKHNYERLVKVPIVTFTSKTKKQACIGRSEFFHHAEHWAKPLSFKKLEQKLLDLVLKENERPPVVEY